MREKVEVMNNPIKNYFQKLYNETGKKPFTFLNVFLLIFVPIIVGIAGMYFTQDADASLRWLIAGVAGGWILDIVLLVINFKAKAVGLIFLHIIASVLFVLTFILIPIIKFGIRSGAAATQANMGNVTASVNASRRAGATKGKKSSLNWFVYDGNTFTDTPEVMPEDIQGQALDEGAYTNEQNVAARNIGYANAKDAEMSGVKIEDLK